MSQRKLEFAAIVNRGAGREVITEPPVPPVPDDLIEDARQHLRSAADAGTKPIQKRAHMIAAGKLISVWLDKDTTSLREALCDPALHPFVSEDLHRLICLLCGHNNEAHKDA